MCLQLKTEEFRKILAVYTATKDVKELFRYLQLSGIVTKNQNATLSINDDYMTKLKFMNDTIKNGDIVYVSNQGLFLVIDTKPASAPDGEHFRALEVTINSEGEFNILRHMRSVVIENRVSYRIKESKFDVKLIEKLSWDRYQAYCRIDEIDKQLAELKEKS